MVTPSLRIIPLDVIGDIPYIVEDGKAAEAGDDRRVAEMTGMAVINGQLVIVNGHKGYDAMFPGVPAEQSHKNHDHKPNWSFRGSYFARRLKMMTN